MEMSKNPFNILRLSCTANRAEVAAVSELFVLEDNDQIETAQLTLLNPIKRLEAEMDWFPDINNCDLHAVRQSIADNKYLRLPQSAGFIAQLNAMLYNLLLLDDSDSVISCILQIDECFSKLSPEVIVSSINACRSRSQFPRIHSADADTQLNRKRADIRQVMTAKLQHFKDEEYIKIVAELARYSREYGLGCVVEDAISQYEIRLFERIEATTSEANLIIQLSIKLLNELGPIARNKKLFDDLHDWNTLVQPLIVQSIVTGIPYMPAVELGHNLFTLIITSKKTKETKAQIRELIETFCMMFSGMPGLHDELSELEPELLCNTEKSELQREQEELKIRFQDLQSQATQIGARTGQALHEDRRRFVSSITDLVKTVHDFKTATEDEKLEIYDGIYTLAADTANRLHFELRETAMAYFLLCQLKPVFSEISDIDTRMQRDIQAMKEYMSGGNSLRANYPGHSEIDQVSEKQLGEWFSLGNQYYHNGEYLKAVEYYRKAAENGYAASQFNLGVCYKTGRGVNHNVKEAFYWYQKSAENGNVNAQIRIGRCYEFGDGVEKDACSAAKWYQKAADQDDSDGLCSLGVCYKNGIGLNKDYKKAAELYRRAAEHGYSRAQCYYALCLANGEGVPRNITEAAHWYRCAAEQGNAQAQNNLGVCYEHGNGVSQDLLEALNWFKRAAEQGEEKAKQNYERLLKMKL